MFRGDDMHNLSDSFQFDADDLAQNRNGELTAAQHKKLEAYRKTYRCGSILAGISIVGSIAVMAGIFIFNSDINSPAMQQALPFIAVTFGSVLLIFVFFILLDRFRARHLRSGKISVVTGSIKRSSKTLQHAGTAYYVTVGKTRFQVPTKAQYDVFQPDTSYRVYYVQYPPTHIILSVENTPS